MYYLRIQSRAIRRLHFNRPAEGTREAELSLVPGKFSVRILPGHWEENILGERHGILEVSRRFSTKLGTLIGEKGFLKGQAILRGKYCRNAAKTQRARTDF